MLRTLQLFLFSTLLLLVSACGWHLQGTIILPPSLHTIYLKSFAPYADLTQLLRQRLQSMHVTLVSDAAQAPITLNIISEIQNNNVIGNTGSQQARMYTLTDVVTYSLDKADGSSITGSMTATASSDYTLPAGSLPSSSAAFTTALSAVRQQIADNIFDRLSSEDIANTINASTNSPHENQAAKPQTTT